MGMNFQDQPSGEKQKQPSPSFDDPRVDDIFIDSPSAGRKILWVLLVVVVIGIVGGGLYMLNKYGYLSFLHRKPVATVVTRTPPPQTPKVTPPAPTVTPSNPVPAGKFAIQVSAFRDKPNADRFAAKLKQRGIDAYVFAGEVPNEGTWYKVCVGSYDTKLRAVANIAAMKEKVGTDAWVVQAQ
jgi:hypothetical protein